MERVTGRDLLSLPVRLHGIELGRPIDVIVDRDTQRVLGLEVHCRDGTDRFLPLAAMRIRDGEIAVASALTLMDEVAFYRARGRALGNLGDVVFEPDGSIG
jgi:sporulation protein YlmC with PRC-barrel domain